MAKKHTISFTEDELEYLVNAVVSIAAPQGLDDPPKTVKNATAIAAYLLKSFFRAKGAKLQNL